MTVGQGADTHLVVVQFAGDIHEAIARRTAGQPETYFAQFYSIAAIEDQVSVFGRVTSLTVVTDGPHDVVESSGMRSVGLGLTSGFSEVEVIKALVRLNPTHIIFRAVMRKAISWAVREQKQVVCVFAESLTNLGFRNRLRNRRLAWALRSHRVRWVGCYGIGSAETYIAAGVDPAKIVPWDFFHAGLSNDFKPKTLAETGTGKVLYVGAMTPAKGVDDLVAAFAILGKSHPRISLTLVGNDKDDRLKKVIAALPQTFDCTQVPFVPNHLLEEFMSEFSVVVVPSRHSYPEGLPLVLTHAMAAKVPVVASDHPMLVRVLTHRQNAMIFPEAQPQALADCLAELLGNADLYRTLSASSGTSLKKIVLPVKFHELCAYGFQDGTRGAAWLRANAFGTTGRRSH
ncbi:MAG: glycosyltransferase family 4 protein [Pseudomonadota bacterium]